MNGRQRLEATIEGARRDRVAVTPIFMAWAAHYIGRTYRDYYLDGDVLVQAQLAVRESFGVDQVSAISDPWREAGAYGVSFDYPEQGVGIPHGPVIRSKDDAASLPLLDLNSAERLRQRIDSVRKLARAVVGECSVLGWVEGPLAEYADLRGVQDALTDLMIQPDWYEAAAGRLVENASAFARAQVEAGADTIGIGDAAASLIGPDLYVEYVLPWESQLVRAIHDAGARVKLHICGDIRGIVAHASATGADVIDVDWMVPLSEARSAVGPKVTLCGNFDPAGVLLQGTPASVADAAKACIEAAGPRFVLQPGCEVPPGTPEENLRAFCPGSSEPPSLLRNVD